MEEIVQVEVLDIREYGVIVRVCGTQQRGLIHISEIVKDYVDDVSDYFYEGQKLNAKVLEVKEDGNLNLSTKDLNIDELKGEIKIKNKEFNKIKEYLISKIGILTPRAEEKLKEIVNKNGFFSFTKVMSDVFNEFQIDYGYLLLDKIERELSGNPFEYYKVTDHALKKYEERFGEKISEKELIKKCYEGIVIVESETDKYVVNEEMFFPVRQEDGKNWVIKTVRHWEEAKDDLSDKFKFYLGGR